MSGEEPNPRLIEDEELQFAADWSGRSVEQTRERLLELWRAAMKGEHAYSCVRGISFLASGLQTHPGYPDALARAKAAPGGCWVEIGCGVGTDLRQARKDGLGSRAIAVDLTPELWRIGLEFYADTTKPPGELKVLDATEERNFQPGGALGDLAGTCAVVACMAVLHTLGREQQRRLAEHFARLLLPGGILIGTAMGLKEGQSRPWDGSDVSASATAANRWILSVAGAEELLEKAGLAEVRVVARPISAELFPNLVASGYISLSFSARKRPEEGRL